MDFLDSARLSGWLRRLGAFAASRQVLDALIPQVVAIAAMFLLAWGIRAATRAWTDRLVARATTLFRVPRIAGELQHLLTFGYAWLLLVIVENVGDRLGSDVRLVGVAASLTALWIVLRASARLLRDAFLARVVATFAWIVAALDILGLLGPTAAALDSLAITVGAFRVSVLLVIKAGLMIAILLWAALALARLISARLQRVTAFSPSIQVLTGNLIKIALVCVALLIGLNTVGIDLTAFTVFSGAVGVGLGFGLQKIVSNFVSGIILLLERSVKPGDVIEVGSTFGSIIFLGARYASVRGRDGKEYLIPNENLITNEVVNWSYSNSLVRLDAEFGVAYASDLHAVRDLSVEVAVATARVLETPRPVCHVTGFGDSAVNLILRFWIADPANGVTNVKGDVLLGLWDAFLERGIELPFPQRDLHIRDLPASAFPRSQRSRAQQGIEEERD